MHFKKTYKKVQKSFLSINMLLHFKVRFKKKNFFSPKNTVSQIRLLSTSMKLQEFYKKLDG